MRILHAISGIDPRNGGTTNALIGLCSGQRHAGLDLRVISTWQQREAFRSAENLERIGVGVRMVGQAYGTLSRHPDLNRSLDEEVRSCDVVHVHGMWEEMQFQACRAARRRGVPYLVTPHGMLSQWSLSHSPIRKRLYLALRLRRQLNAAAALQFTTTPEQESAARLRLHPATFIEPLGIDLAEFASPPRRGLFRERHGLDETKRLIVFLGRIHRGKGLEYLVPAFARLQDRESTLAIVGPDSRGFQREIEQSIAQLGLGNRVIFTGMLSGEDKLSVLVDADLFCLPSSHENFGLSIIEALAVGTPVVISDHVNIQKEIAAAGVGSVVRLDVAELATELDGWLADEPRRQRVAHAAPSFVRQTYDWDAIGRRWVGHYAALARRDDALHPTPAAAMGKSPTGG